MKAPSFTLLDQNGNPHSLSDYKGKYLVIYFYPKDDTPACTKEACNFRDGFEEFNKRGIKVVGISKDSVSSHKKFEKKHNLNFILLSDPTNKTIEAFGAWAPKKFMGREFLGTLRNTYIVDPNGEIVKVYENIDPSDHIEMIHKDLTQLLS